MTDVFDPYYRWLGIPPKDQPPDHYRLLSVERFEPHVDVIAEAADRQMAHLRTRQTGPHAALAAKLLNEIAAARVCLLSPDRKAGYDERLAAQLHVLQQKAAEATMAVSVPSSSKTTHSARPYRFALIAAAVLFCVIGGWTLHAVLSTPDPNVKSEVVKGQRPETEPSEATSDAKPPKSAPSSHVELSSAVDEEERLAVASQPLTNAKTSETPNQPTKPPSTVTQHSSRATSNRAVPPATNERAGLDSQASSVPPAGDIAKHSSTPADEAAPLVDTHDAQTEESIRSTEPSPGIKEQSKFVVGIEPLIGFAMSVDGRRLAAVSQKNQLYIIDLQEGREIQSFSAADLEVDHLALVPDGRYLLASGVVSHSGATQLRTYRTSAAVELTSVPVTHGVGTALAISTNGAMFAVGHRQGVLTLHSTRDASQPAVLYASERATEIGTLAFSSDNQHLVFGDRTGEVHIAQISARRPSVLQHLPAHTSAVHSLGISLQGDVLMTAAVDGAVRLWRDWRGRADAQPVLRLETMAKARGKAALSAAGNLVATAGDNGEITLWNTGTGKPHTKFTSHSSAVVGLAFLPDGNRLASAGADGTVRIWKFSPADAAGKVTSSEPVARRPENVVDQTFLKQDSTGSSPAVSAASPHLRQPIPSPSELTKSQSLVDRTFGAERMDATQDVGRLNLAQKLIAHAEASETSPNDRYALLLEAQSLAALAGNSRLAYSLHDQLAKRFEIDVADSVVQLSQLLAQHVDTASEKVAAGRAALDRVPVAIAADRIDAARLLCAVAIETVGDPATSALKEQLRSCQSQLDLAEGLLNEVRTAAITREQTSLSPAQRLLLGRYLCFNQGDWKAGLEQLALAEQGELSAVAALDWSDPAEPQKQLALAERWMALSRKFSGNQTKVTSTEPERDLVIAIVAKSAAAYWLEEALHNLTKTARDGVEQQLNGLRADRLLISRKSF